VALEGAPDLYLTADDLLGSGLVVTGVVRRGELVPRSAVGSSTGTASTALVLPLAGDVSASVVPGALVDVWASSASRSPDAGPSAAGPTGPPVVIVPEATVVRLVDDDDFVSTGEGRSVEVLIPRERIARVLQAMADRDALAIVPAGVPLAAR
jgi:hypothetical protein